MLLLFLFFINFTLLFPKDNLTNDTNINLKIREDVEIENIEIEINSLKEKIKKLEKMKELKNNNLSNQNLKVGLALSGGGAKGYAHLGALKILEKENIKIDYITGTSIGALIGTLYSIGYSIDEIKNILDEINIESFLESGTNLSNFSIEEKESLRNYSFYIGYDNNLKFSLPKGIRNNKYMYLKLRKILKNFVDIKNFDELPIPIRIIATNLNSGKTKAFSKGDLAQILTASMALPAIIEPVKINNEPYVDGLVSRNLPVQDCYDMGADIVVACDIGKEIEKKEQYNIFSVINQIVEIQSFNSTEKEREKATILIHPDIQDISALDTTKKKKLEKLGEEAALSKLNLLNKLPKKKKNNINDKFADLKYKNREFFIKNIIYSDNFRSKTIEVLEDTFAPLINKQVKENEIEKKINKIQNLNFLESIYYSVSDNTLYINGKDDYQNKLGLNFKYKSDYEATLSLGTDVYLKGLLKNNIHANIKIGDYYGFKIFANSYYGSKNKIGAFASLGYDQLPYYFYKKNRKIAKFINKQPFIDLGIFTQATKNSYFALGLNSKFVNLKLDTGDSKEKKLEYAKNINRTYIRFKYDSLDSLAFPMSGIKADFIYNFSTSFSGSRSNSYGPSYSIKGYKPINKKVSLIYGLNSALLTGKNIKVDQYIKLGGIGNNIENNEFEFYGFNFQEKSVDKFLSMSLGLRYKPVYSIYLSTKLNTVTFSDSRYNRESKNRMWKDFSKGLSISAGYDSPIGPVEFSVSTDLKERSPIASISIGYTLD
ncbi:MAG: patatin-like phospholipase family protein [Fusobacterium sp.]|nr:patatin-like phospholipase family protein [Fusobacterium sp.]